MLVIYRFYTQTWTITKKNPTQLSPLLHQGLLYTLDHNMKRLIHQYFTDQAGAVNHTSTSTLGRLRQHKWQILMALTINSVWRHKHVHLWRKEPLPVHLDVRYACDCIPAVSLFMSVRWLHWLSDSKGNSWRWHLPACYFLETPSRTTGC